MAPCLHQDAERKQRGSNQQCPGQQLFDLFRQANVIKSNRQDNEEHRETDPVSMHVYLAIVNIFRLAVLKLRDFSAPTEFLSAAAWNPEESE